MIDHDDIDNDVDKGSGDDYGDNDNHLNTEQNQNYQRSMSMLIVELLGWPGLPSDQQS